MDLTVDDVDLTADDVDVTIVIDDRQDRRRDQRSNRRANHRRKDPDTLLAPTKDADTLLAEMLQREKLGPAACESHGRVPAAAAQEIAPAQRRQEEPRDIREERLLRARALTKDISAPCQEPSPPVQNKSPTGNDEQDLLASLSQALTTSLAGVNEDHGIDRGGDPGSDQDRCSAPRRERSSPRQEQSQPGCDEADLLASLSRALQTPAKEDTPSAPPCDRSLPHRSSPPPRDSDPPVKRSKWDQQSGPSPETHVKHHVEIPPVLVRAWDSPIHRCSLCRTPGCKYRAVADSEYCCQGCSGELFTPGGCVPTAKGVIPDQDKFHARRVPEGAATKKSLRHDAGCAMLEAEILQGSWWEELRIDSAAEVDSACLVVPPADEAACAPAPVILMLSGEGHVNDRQDFLWGGVDLLIRNPHVRKHCFLLAMKPTTSCGLLRYNDQWKFTWSEDAVWTFFTEVLRRLGPKRVDPGRLYATGLSLGAAGVWSLAIRYGHYLAAIAPISGACEWPGGSWPKDGHPDATVVARLKDLPIRSYQIDVDFHAGSQKDDMQELCRDSVVSERDLVLPGMEAGKTCSVHVHEWRRKSGGATWEFWGARGPLADWSVWDDWGGDKHFMWQRVYPIPAWGLAEFFLKHSVPEGRRWRFDSPPVVVDIQAKTLESLSKASLSMQSSARKPWAEQLQDYSKNFFEALFLACGDRPSFDKVDFCPTVKYGVQVYLAQLHPYMNSPDFEAALHKAVHFGCDKIRYYLRSMLAMRKALEGSKWKQKAIKDAVNSAREEAVQEMFTMNAAEFISMWIRKTKDKLEEIESLHILARMSALKLFREVVLEGGGMPIPLMQDMAGVKVAEWEPLTRTVNRFFDDPEPEWKPSKKDWSEDASEGSWGRGDGWTAKGQQSMKGQQWTMATKGGNSWNGQDNGMKGAMWKGKGKGWYGPY